MRSVNGLFDAFPFAVVHRALSVVFMAVIPLNNPNVGDQQRYRPSDLSRVGFDLYDTTDRACVQIQHVDVLRNAQKRPWRAWLTGGV